MKSSANLSKQQHVEENRDNWNQRNSRTRKARWIHIGLEIHTRLAYEQKHCINKVKLTCESKPLVT
jgi:hypothetical protein